MIKEENKVLASALNVHMQYTHMNMSTYLQHIRKEDLISKRKTDILACRLHWTVKLLIYI